MSVRLNHPYLPFSVDEEGRVYGKKGSLLKGTDNGAGYLRVSFRQAGSRKTHTALLHRVVAETLLPNPYEKPTVNHKDGDKTNNHPLNLEWATYGENNQHAWDTGLIAAYERTPAHRERLGRIAATHQRGPKGWCIA